MKLFWKYHFVKRYNLSTFVTENDEKHLIIINIHTSIDQRLIK